jgi:hypothetical protein
VWFLWREPWTRVPFAAVFGLHAAAVLAMGWGPSWAARLVASGSEVASVFNYAPSRIIGVAWIPIGIVLGVIAFRRGRPALAGLLVSPYWLPYYFLLPLAELAPRLGDRERVHPAVEVGVGAAVLERAVTEPPRLP